MDTSTDHRVAGTTRRRATRPGYPDVLTITCTCGTTATSKRGGPTGAWSAYDKHLARAAAKAGA